MIHWFVNLEQRVIQRFPKVHLHCAKTCFVPYLSLPHGQGFKPVKNMIAHVFCFFFQINDYSSQVGYSWSMWKNSKISAVKSPVSHSKTSGGDAVSTDSDPLMQPDARFSPGCLGHWLIAIENGWPFIVFFVCKKWWFSIAMLVITRG